MTHTVEWFFGRGLSIGCGLAWSVPADWIHLPRGEQIARIKSAVTAEMSAPYVRSDDIAKFLDLIAARTASRWQHRFYTTNWDFLLQREILRLEFKVQPEWCAETHVYHLNGTVEDLPDNSRRSAFVLESDEFRARVATTEGDIAFNKFIWSDVFAVVGMSFECEVDKYLLAAIRRVQDDLPIGSSLWIVVNPDELALRACCTRLQEALPRARVIGRATTFGQWLEAGLPELQDAGALVPEASAV